MITKLTAAQSPNRFTTDARFIIRTPSPEFLSGQYL